MKSCKETAERADLENNSWKDFNLRDEQRKKQLQRNNKNVIVEAGGTLTHLTKILYKQ